GINRARKKKRESKKREKMKIIRSGVGLPPQVISSPCTGRKNVSPCRRSNKVTWKLLDTVLVFPRGRFLLPALVEKMYPRVGRSNEATLDWFGSVRFGPVGYGPVRFGSVPFGPVSIDFDNRRSISGGINRGRKKKRESKKREKMEIIRSGVGLPPRVISSPCISRKNVSPCRRSNEATFGAIQWGSVKFGRAWLGLAWLSFDFVRFDSVRLGSVGFDSLGSVRLDSVRFGLDRLGSTRFGSARFDGVWWSSVFSVGLGGVGFDSIEFCSFRFDSMQFGAMRCGAIRFGSVRCDAFRFSVIQWGSVKFDRVSQP
ncbi:hypothetical protein BHE74_00050806, partial [Ensete ventricosum]